MATRERTRTKLLDAADHLLFTGGSPRRPSTRSSRGPGPPRDPLTAPTAARRLWSRRRAERRHAAWLEVWDAAVAAAPDDRGRLLAVLDAWRRSGAARRGAVVRVPGHRGRGGRPARRARDGARARHHLPDRAAGRVRGAGHRPRRRGRRPRRRPAARGHGHLAMHLRDAADPAATRRVAETLVDAHTGRTARPSASRARRRARVLPVSGHRNAARTRAALGSSGVGRRPRRPRGQPASRAGRTPPPPGEASARQSGLVARRSRPRGRVRCDRQPVGWGHWVCVSGCASEGVRRPRLSAEVGGALGGVEGERDRVAQTLEVVAAACGSTSSARRFATFAPEFSAVVAAARSRF